MRSDNVRRCFFPYCIRKMNNGNWIMLNRNYKPVGQADNFHADYDEPSIQFKISGQKERAMRKKFDFDGDDFYLYNDGSVPTFNKRYMNIYLEKLVYLMDIRITVREPDNNWMCPAYNKAEQSKLIEAPIYNPESDFY